MDPKPAQFAPAHARVFVAGDSIHWMDWGVVLPPCGRCRELIAEFNPRAWVILSRREDHWDPDAIQHPAKVPIGALLPRKSHQLKG